MFSSWVLIQTTPRDTSILEQQKVTPSINNGFVILIVLQFSNKFLIPTFHTFILLVLVPKSSRQVEKTRKSHSRPPSDLLAKPVWPVSASRQCVLQRPPFKKSILSYAYRPSRTTAVPRPRRLFAEKLASIHTWRNALSLLSNPVKPVWTCPYGFTAKSGGQLAIPAASLCKIASFRGKTTQALRKPVS